MSYKLLLFYWCLVFIFSPLLWAQQPASSSQGSLILIPKHSGASYLSEKGGDLGKLLQRTATKDAVGRFSIWISGELPKTSAQLSIYAFDVDEERGETLSIFLNGAFIGKVSGTDNSWNTSVFEVRKELLVKGENKIHFVISDSSQKGTIKWSGKVGWGQILIDGGAAESGTIQGQIVSHKQEEENAKTHISTDVHAVTSGSFKLEVSMIDVEGNVVVAGTKDLTMKKGETTQISMDLVYSPSIPDGEYNIVTNLFFKKGTSLRQQDIRKHIFSYEKMRPPQTELFVHKPLADVDVTEDALPLEIDLSPVFAFKENETVIPAGQGLIVKSVLRNNNPNLLLASIQGENLILENQPGATGEAEIFIQATFEGKSSFTAFRVIVNPKPLKIAIAPKPLPVPVIKPLPPAILSTPIIESTPEPVAKNMALKIAPPAPKPLPPSPEIAVIDQTSISAKKLTKSPLYTYVPIGLQSLSQYQSSGFLGIAFGKEFKTVLGKLAIESAFTQTINAHQKSKDGVVFSQVWVQSLSLSCVYTFYAQFPEPIDPFSTNPLRLRLKLGFSQSEYKEEMAISNSSWENGMTELNVGLEVGKKVHEKGELFLQLSKPGADLSQIGIGYQHFFTSQK